MRIFMSLNIVYKKPNINKDNLSKIILLLWLKSVINIVEIVITTLAFREKRNLYFFCLRIETNMKRWRNSE